jgi:hypothetical protein
MQTGGADREVALACIFTPIKILYLPVVFEATAFEQNNFIATVDKIQSHRYSCDTGSDNTYIALYERILIYIPGIDMHS